MARSKLILARRLANSHQISQCLVFRVSYPHLGELAGAEAACEFHRAAPDRPRLAAFSGTSVGAMNSHCTPHLRQLHVERVSGRPTS